MKSASQHAKAPGPPKAPAPAPTRSPAAPPPIQQLRFDLHRIVPGMAFFTVFFLCLWKWIDVGLIYHGGGQVKDFPCFYWSWDFASDFRGHPGGLVEYGSALLAQALCFSAYGALVLMLQAALAYVGMDRYLRALSLTKLRIVAYLPPLLVLSIYAKYRYYAAPVTSFSLAAALLWAWVRWFGERPVWRLVAALALVAALFAAAPSALLVLLPMVVLFEVHSGTAWWKALLWLVASGLIPWPEGALLFGFAPVESYAKLLPLPWDAAAWNMVGANLVGALFFLPALCCLVGLFTELGQRLERKHSAPDQRASGAALSAAEKTSARVAADTPSKRTERRGSKERKAPALSRGRWWKTQSLALALAPAIVLYCVLSPVLKAFLKVDYLAWHGRWAEVAAAAQANPRNAFVACAVSQASFHNGTLTRQLPFLPAPTDLMLYSDKLQSHWKKSDLYYDLGYVNMALHHLTESVEYYGERPILLQRLALVNLALGNLPTAKVYLGTLARAPFQGRWARTYLERLKSDPTLAGDPEINRLRQCLVKRDYVLAFSVEEELQLLLGADRQNRMAFEYLMTYYLMTKNLTAFVKNISRVKDFPGFEITPLWDEALLLAARQGKPPTDLPGHSIRPQASARLEMVIKVIQQHADQKELARRELSAAYADSYSYYWYFHR